MAQQSKIAVTLHLSTNLELSTGIYIQSDSKEHEKIAQVVVHRITRALRRRCD